MLRGGFRSGFPFAASGTPLLYFPQSVVHHVGPGATGGLPTLISPHIKGIESGVDVSEKHARPFVLAVAALACDAESGEHRQVCVSRSGRGSFAIQARCHVGFADDVA